MRTKGTDLDLRVKGGSADCDGSAPLEAVGRCVCGGGEDSKTGVDNRPVVGPTCGRIIRPQRNDFLNGQASNAVARTRDVRVADAGLSRCNDRSGRGFVSLWNQCRTF